MRLVPSLLVLDVAAGLAGLALVAGSVLGPGGAAAAAGSGSDGSDWGSEGRLTTNSGIVATWDGTGNVAASRVPRDATQTIAHTAGKTYDDLPRADRAAYAAAYGPGNGLGGLTVSVSQGQDLVNKSITVEISGAKPVVPRGASQPTNYLQVFQCWGSPVTGATSPDPATCQVGSGGPDSLGASTFREQRTVLGDRLVAGGDWARYAVFPRVDVPFLAVDGTESESTSLNKNVYFNRTTTNEQSNVVISADGTATRQFEVQTGQESQGLGCGLRADQPSVSSCWLVVVPRLQDVDNGIGPISPSVWAQRMQFQLGFQDTAVSCTSGQARSLTGGSEMLVSAARSWIPGVCDDRSVSLGYSRLGDEVARSQFVSGASNAVLTSRPVPASSPTVPVPLTLAAPVIGFNLDYKPECRSAGPDQDPLDIAQVSTEAAARACGYPDLATLVADRARAGQPVRDLRLNARLVAKLLTMSYQAGMIGCLGDGCQTAVFRGHLPAWVAQRPVSLTADPEFQALNPQLHMKPDTDIGQMIVEATRSDAAAEVWSWVLADPDGASFLAGCPDTAGVVVNPFFSSRTYTGCADRRDELAARADAARTAMENLPAGSPIDQPVGFVDQAITYPPDGSPFPLPSWQQLKATAASGTGSATTAQTLVDIQPRVDAMQIGARDAFIGYRPRNSEFCSTEADPVGCVPAPGKWRDPKVYSRYGDRQIFTVTDTPSAARYQLTTARLCGGAGGECVGADTASLQAAAARFVDSDVPGYQRPGPADYAAGAYPLTLPVYAAVDPAATEAERTSYADAFDYVTTDGQVPGYRAGLLPPGYAPLTTGMAASAQAAITALRAPGAVAAAPAGILDPVQVRATSSPKKKKQGKPSPTASPSASPSSTPGDPGSGGGGGGAVGEAVEPPPGPAASPAAADPSAAPGADSTAAADTAVQTAPVAASSESWPGWLLPVGLGLAMGAGMAGPFLRRRTNVTLR